MRNSRDFESDLAACAGSITVHRDGAFTDIHFSNDVRNGSPLYDSDCDNISVPFLLELLDQWLQEGKITRLIRFHEGGESSRWYHLVEPGLLMCLYDHEVAAERSSPPFWIDGWALLKINLHGSIAFRIGEELLELNEASGMLTYGVGVPINKNVSSEDPETSATILFNPVELYKKLGAQNSHLRDLLGEGEGTVGSVTQLLRVDGRLVDLVRQLMDLNKTDFLYFLEVEALTKKVLLHSLRLLDKLSGEDNTAHRLREQDIDKLTQVKNRLESDFGHQFSLDDLSRQAGLNRRKLTEGFKGLFGATVNEYLLRQRMISAADMLRKGVLATEVAHQVGYKEQSSFTRAFKRYYGILPRDFCA